MQDSRTLYFRVEGWSNARCGRVEGNLISFEVMYWGCACSTCLARLHAVRNRMSESDVKWQVQDIFIPERGGMPSAVLMVEPKEMPEKVDAYLGALLGLQIREA